MDHTADWALRVRGETLGKLLENAALGMLHLAGAEPRPQAPSPDTITLSAPDPESLLVGWLEELLYRMETRQVTFPRVRARVEGDTHLTAEVEEAPLAALGRSIKAVTFHDLKIARTPEGYAATLVFDV